jgi:hypothetical protein
MTKKMQIGRVLRTALLGSTVLGVMPSAVGCLDRPVAPATPRTSNTLTDQVQIAAVDKIDLLFMIDNSASMADKQKVLAKAVPDLVDRLINPVCVEPLAGGKVNPKPDQTPSDPNAPCPAGLVREFSAIKDIHIGVVTSSLGAHGADTCVDVEKNDPSQNLSQKNFTKNDRGRLINRGPRPEDSTTVNFGADIKTYKDAGFFSWDPDSKKVPSGESDPTTLKNNFSQVVIGADQIGCGFEASLEAWYRFLVDPSPYAIIPQVTPTPEVFPVPQPQGVDEVLLAQRAEFLRPDSLVAVINLSDENDCSVIDGVLPPDVCENPTFDDKGNPNGCNGDRVGWPAGYVEGNFDKWVNNGGRVTGAPFPLNYLTAQVGSFRMSSGTAECSTDEYSTDCRHCYGNGAQGCVSLANPIGEDPEPDPPNLRCWNQKKRFGVDMLYPLQRYIDGLSKTKIYDRNGFLVQNPLFDDLPYKRAAALDRENNTQENVQKLGRPRASQRPQTLVFFASIVGVPWQDIAKNPQDLKQGYKLVNSEDPEQNINWDLILGNPFAIDPAKRKPAEDPLMREDKFARTGTHPITKEELGPDKWNSINGREWNPGGQDLQFACIFDLEAPRDCTNSTASCDCNNDIEAQKSPLCETAPDSKTYTKQQLRAKAYPGTRFLHVAKNFGSNAIVASICTPNLKNEADPDFGYRPAVAAIIDRLKSQLAGRCLPRQLAANPDGSTPCLIIDAKLRKDPNFPNNESEVAACQKCDGVGRKQIDPNIRSLITGGVLEYDCLCEITQLTGNDLTECQTTKDLPLLSSGNNNGGWCYVDPGVAADKDAASAIVEKCPANEKRTIRFVNAQTENSTLFITCLGAASGQEIVETAGNLGIERLSTPDPCPPGGGFAFL